MTLTYVPGYSTISVAEHALGLLLTLSRRIHLGNDRSRGLVPAETSLRGFELAGRTLGIVAFGRIGSVFGRLGQALGMRVLAVDTRRGHVESDGVRLVSYGEVLRCADAIAMLCSADLLPFVLRAFRGDRRSLGLLIAGVAFAVLAVAGDSLNVNTLPLTMEIREQTSEELVELASSVCFLLALWLRLVPALALPDPQPSEPKAGDVGYADDARPDPAASRR